jgi:tetratricopeptide (TPR) repeat protein
MWRIELTSCPEEKARPIELTNYLKEQLGETSDLWTLGDFLMNMGEYKKAEKYFNILENDPNLPEQHVDRVRIYNRLGIIRREQNELQLAIDYFRKAVNAAPSDSNMGRTANDNMQVVQEELKRAPKVFLGKRLAASNVISKSLVANEISIPILENNLGHAAYHERNYDEAITHYQKAISIMMTSELAYLLEISCVYNNLGAVEYDKGDYCRAKDYFQKAIFTLQKFTLKHPWIADYKENLVCAQKEIRKRQRVE